MRRRRVASAPHLLAAASSMPGSRSRPAGRRGGAASAAAAVDDAAPPSARLRCFGRAMAVIESCQAGSRALPSVPLRATAHSRGASNGPPPTSSDEPCRQLAWKAPNRRQLQPPRWRARMEGGRFRSPLKPQTRGPSKSPSAALIPPLRPSRRARALAAAAAAAAAAGSPGQRRRRRLKQLLAVMVSFPRPRCCCPPVSPRRLRRLACGAGPRRAPSEERRAPSAPHQINEIKDFLLTARRKDARCGFPLETHLRLLKPFSLR
eukprot:SM000079S22509  [mRNA]  locus=s79:570148:571181:- [translate_table: standard]